MIYAKHPEFGNGHFLDGERTTLEAQGWVIWPRTKEQKAGPPAAPVPSAAPSEAPPAYSPAPAPVVAAPPKLTRKELLAYAEQKRIKVDRRWTDERLAQELKL